MTPQQIEGLLVALAAIVTPSLLFALWLMWLELRKTQELADYYCRQWEDLAAVIRRERREEEQAQREAAADWLADW